MKCDYCPLKFNTISMWMYHINYKFNHNNIDTKCLTCGFNEPNLKKLMIHIKSRVCRNDMPKDQCKYCNKCFTNKRGLYKHYKLNTCLSKKPNKKFKLKCNWNYKGIELFNNVTNYELYMEFNRELKLPNIPFYPINDELDDKLDDIDLNELLDTE